jgi:hypothetical protein
MVGGHRDYLCSPGAGRLALTLIWWGMLVACMSCGKAMRPGAGALMIAWLSMTCSLRHWAWLAP